MHLGISIELGVLLCAVGLVVLPRFARAVTAVVKQ